MTTNRPRHLIAGLAAASALLLAGSTIRAQERPQLAPARDVDITYEIARPRQPAIRQRVRWLAGEGLERIDGSDRSITIIDRRGNEVTLLTPRTRTYRKVAGVSRQPMAPDQDAVLRRGGEARVAGQPADTLADGRLPRSRDLVGDIDVPGGGELRPLLRADRRSGEKQGRGRGEAGNEMARAVRRHALQYRSRSFGSPQ